MAPTPQVQQQEVDESEEDFARMRDLLRSTQDEVDRIIQGSNNIQEVYTESQQFVSQTQANKNTIGANSAQIIGGKVIKEVSLNAANLNTL